MTINVTPVNDAPVAVDDTFSTGEDTAVTITSAGLFGADGTGPSNDSDADSASFSSITVTALATDGVLKLDGVAVTLNQVITVADIAAGKLTFVPDGDENGSPYATFKYTVSDGALSSNEATVTINVTPVNDAPTVTPGMVRVSEEGLAWANPDSAGNPTDTTNVKTASGNLVITDPDNTTFTVTLGAPAPGTYTSGGQNIVWTLSNTNHTLTGTVGSAIIMVVSIDDAGAYTVMLSGPVDQPLGNQENLLPMVFGVNVNDGTVTTASSLTVTVEDDSPIQAVTNGIFQNGVGTQLVGTLASIGADNTASKVTLSGAPPANLTSNGVALTYNLSDGGSTLTAKAGSDTVFTLTAHPDGTYTFTQLALLDLTILSTNLQSGIGAGGPHNSYYVYVDGSFGPVENAKDWAVKITGSAGINPSTPGMGVGNNLFETGETMRFEFDDEHASSIGGTTPNLAYQTRIGITDISGTESVNWTAYFTDGSTQTGVATALNLVNGAIVITAPGGFYIDYVDLAAGVDTSVRINGLTNLVQNDTGTANLTFGFVATDGDGDAVSGSLSVLAQNSSTLTGGTGNDALGGGIGANILIGGDGDDILTGGLGADVFRWQAGDIGTDTIIDFNKAQGDVLNLKDLLIGEGGTFASNNLADYLTFSLVGGDTVISVDADGAGPDGIVQTIVLQGVDLVTGAGSQQDIVNNLLGSGHLVADVMP